MRRGIAERVDLTVPANWQEVTREQLAIIASMMNEQLSREETLFVLFCRMAGIRMDGGQRTGDGGQGTGDFVTRDGQRIRLETWQLADFCNRLAFTLDTLPCDIVNPTRVNRYLDDIKFGDYFHADALMYRYRLENDPSLVWKALNDLGDHRRGVSPLFANEVALWWAGVMQWLKGQYPLVLDSEGGSAEGYDPLKARQNIMLMLNNDCPQDNERIEQSKMHDVLAALQNKIELAKKREEQMAALRKKN